MLSTDFSPEIWLSMNFWRVATFAFGNELKVRSSAAGVRTRLAALHQDERVEVFRSLDVPVERCGRDRHRSERRASRRRIEDALDVEQFAGPVRKCQRDGRTDSEPVALCVALVDEGAVLAERGEHGSGAHLPVEVEHPARCRVDGGRGDRLAEGARLSCAHISDGDDAGRLGDRIRRRDGNRREVVLRSDRVVGVLPDLVDGAPEAGDDSGCQYRHERDQREADHQSGGRRRCPLRISLRVLTRKNAGAAAELGRRPSQCSRERRYQSHRQQRDAEEDQERTAEHEQEHPCRPEAGCEQPPQERPETECRE